MVSMASNGAGGSGTRMIVGIVLGVITVIFAYNLFDDHVRAGDKIYRQYVARCDVGTNDTIRLHAPEAIAGVTRKHGAITAMQVFIVSADGTGCQITTPAASGVTSSSKQLAATLTLRTEDEESVTIDIAASSGNTAITKGTVSGGSWKQPGDAVKRFGNLNQLLASIYPLLMSLATLSLGLVLSVRYYQTGDVKETFSKEVYALIGALVAAYMMPMALTALEGAYTIVGSDVVTSTNRFKGIIEVVFGIVPLLFNVALIGTAGWGVYSGAKTAMDMKGNIAGMIPGRS